MKLFLIKYRLLIIIGVPVLFFLVIFFSISAPSQNKLPSPTQIPTPVRTLEQEINENLKFEISVDNDRHEFDNPQEIPGYLGQQTLPNESIQYTYSSSNPQRPNIIIVSPESLIEFKRIIVSENQPLTLESFTSLYGPARWIFEGSVFYGDDIRTHIYPDYGLALMVDGKSGLVLEQHVFMRTSIEEYIRKYGEDIPARSEP